jgi:hypothetical protein
MKILGLHSVMVALGVGSLVFASACSSSSNPVATGSDASTDTGSGGGFPGITISSPASGAAVTLMPPQDAVPISFAVTNFTLMAPGTCAGATNCGHIHILVDGPACTPDGAPYNNDATSSPGNALLNACPTANGSHTATLEIHHDDHSPFLGASGTVISTSVSFTASGG